MVRYFLRTFPIFLSFCCTLAYSENSQNSEKALRSSLGLYSRKEAKSVALKFKDISRKMKLSDDVFLDSLQDLTRNYATLYRHFALSFHDHEKKRLILSPKLSTQKIKKHLCLGLLENFCKDYSQKVDQMIGFEVQNFPEKNNEEVRYESFQHMNELTKSIDSLRLHYESYEKNLFEVFQDVSTLSAVNTTSMNKYLESFGGDVDTLISRYTYQEAYNEAVKTYPGAILNTEYFMTFIEANYFNLEKMDLVNAIEEITNKLKRRFLVDLMASLLRSHNVLVDQVVMSRLSGEEKNFLKQFDSIEPKGLWVELNQGVLWTGASFTYPFKVTSERMVDYINQFSCGNGKAVALLAREEVQRAIWVLRKDSLDCSRKLEAAVKNDWMVTNQVRQSQPLGGGFTETLLARFNDGLKGIFKPKPNPLTQPLDSFVSDYQSEIAAHILDNLLGLDMVPITQEVYIDGKVGSTQLWVDHAVSARSFLPIRSDKKGKFDKPSGRATKIQDMLLFDWLIDNHDRNVENYLYLMDGTIVLIDNSFSFFSKRAHSFEKKFLGSEVSPYLIRNLRRLHDNEHLLDNAFKNVLSEANLQALKTRIAYFLTTI